MVQSLSGVILRCQLNVSFMLLLGTVVQFIHDSALIIKVFGLYSLVSTEMFTRPSFPRRHVQTETISIPRGIFQSSWQHKL